MTTSAPPQGLPHAGGTAQELRVLHLITDLDRGGAETFLRRLVTWPDWPGVSHGIVSLMPGGAVAEEARAAGIAVDTLGVGGMAAVPRAVWRLRRLLRRQKPHVLMTWLYHADFVGTLAVAMAPGVKLVWNIRCADMDLSRYGVLTRALPRLLARLSMLPDLILANSQAGRTVHAAYGYRPKRWVTLGNGFDTATFRPDDEKRRAVRSELGIDEGTPLVGLFARFDPMKDHATFLAAAAMLANRDPAPTFLLVGRGTTGAAFEALAGSHESLRGRLIALGERDDVPALMTACDVIACSSVSEGFPNTVGEAMACGVPCVSTDVGDAAVIIGDKGRLVAKSDPKALATAIGGILDSAPGERQRLGAAARRRIEENFAFGTVVENYRRLLADVAGR
jgi:glycosyltransferase involved in cell wall biosynthesis